MIQEIFERFAQDKGWLSASDCINNAQYSTVWRFFEKTCKEYARLMCDKQKEICANNAITGAYIKHRTKGAKYKPLKNNEGFDMFNTTQMYKVEKKSIINTPYPEELL